MLFCVVASIFVSFVWLQLMRKKCLSMKMILHSASGVVICQPFELVRSFGADQVIRRGTNVALAMLEKFPNGVDGLADGAVQNEAVIPAVRDGGAFTAVRGFIGNPQRNINFSQTFVRNYDCEFEKLDALRKLVNAGKLSLRVADTFTPENVSSAHTRLEAGGTRGRLVIEF